ncbi:MAG: YgjV family protein [Ferruginibacter sp.]
MLALAPYFGYLASLCLIIALLVNNDLRFRWFNTMGTVFFIIYAIILGVLPVLLTNLILFTINAYYLVKVYRKQEKFDMLEFRGDEQMALKFLSFYSRDIDLYFPGFEPAAMNGNLNFVVTRDLVIANMFSASVSEDGDATVLLNYTVQKYRDYKVGTYIFEKEKDFLVKKGIKRIVYTSVPNKKHYQFLKVMGFTTEMINGHECMVKRLNSN